MELVGCVGEDLGCEGPSVGWGVSMRVCPAWVGAGGIVLHTVQNRALFSSVLLMAPVTVASGCITGFIPKLSCEVGLGRT